MISPLLFIFFLLFVCLVFINFSLPGLITLEKARIKMNVWEKVIIGTVLGFVTFTLISYLLLITGLHLLLPFLIFGGTVLFLKDGINILKNQLVLPKKSHLILLTSIFFFGIGGQLAIIAPSGMNISGDLVFWSSHGHDGMWHIALVEELKKGFPLQNPIFSGSKLVNYHFFSDITIADFNYFFKLSSLDLYFRFFPFLFSFLLGGLAFLIGQKLGKSFASGIWSMFFTYFAGSFGYIVTFIKDKSIGGESLFWSSQIQSIIGNPPQMIALVIILTFTYLFITYIENQNRILLIMMIILAGSLTIFKVYAGVTLLGVITIISLIRFAKERKKDFLILTIVSIILSLLLYLPYTSKTASFLILEPWWFIRTMVVAPDRLGWLDMELKRQTYIVENNWKRVIQLEITAFLIFLFGNLGMRFIGFYTVFILLKNFRNYLTYYIFLFLFISLIFPLLFLQKGVASNTSQFLQYFLLFFGILAGVSANKIINQISFSPLKIIFCFLVISLAIPTQVGLLYSFYKRPPLAVIKQDEVQALKFLFNNTDKNSVILTPAYNRFSPIKFSQTPPIWLWSDTAYVSALSGRRTYNSDLEQLDIMGYDFKDRLTFQNSLFQEDNPSEFEKIIKEISINYLYFPKELKPKIDLDKTSMENVFTNSNIEVWKSN
ncbi:hypothetical protein C4577_00420 [Candidatus Parcubacteria bacterium]|nr:MAG: hypothetical protein C4577_00420 [Candidatus Parcubacteria bacterium]